MYHLGENLANRHLDATKKNQKNSKNTKKLKKEKKVPLMKTWQTGIMVAKKMRSTKMVKT